MRVSFSCLLPMSLQMTVLLRMTLLFFWHREMRWTLLFQILHWLCHHYAGGCAVLWVSKQQTTIALTTIMQAVYKALPTSCHDLIPLHHIITEDLTALHKARPAHCLWRHQRMCSGVLHILKIDTAVNPADIFTKGLPVVTEKLTNSTVVGKILSNLLSWEGEVKSKLHLSRNSVTMWIFRHWSTCSTWPFRCH